MLGVGPTTMASKPPQNIQDHSLQRHVNLSVLWYFHVWPFLKIETDSCKVMFGDWE